MGGTSANRLTGLTAGVDGDTLGGTGGAESHTLTTAQLASHSHANTASASTTVSITDSGHTHTINGESVANVQDALNGDGQRVLESTLSGGADTEASASATTGITATGSTTVTMTNANTGGGEAHNNVQPTIILNYIIKT
jgi:microcystin-dependent protein